MDGMEQEVHQIATILGFSENINDIMDYMKNIPEEFDQSRTQITLRYFLLKKDKNLINESNLQSEAKNIINILKLDDNVFDLIISRLNALGHFENREEAVIRQLLHERGNYLDEKIMQINKKRKISLNDNQFPKNKHWKSEVHLNGIDIPEPLPIQNGEVHSGSANTYDSQETVNYEIDNVDFSNFFGPFGSQSEVNDTHLEVKEDTFYPRCSTFSSHSDNQKGESIMHNIPTTSATPNNIANEYVCKPFIPEMETGNSSKFNKQENSTSGTFQSNNFINVATPNNIAIEYVYKPFLPEMETGNSSKINKQENSTSGTFQSNNFINVAPQVNSSLNVPGSSNFCTTYPSSSKNNILIDQSNAQPSCSKSNMNTIDFWQNLSFITSANELNSPGLKVVPNFITPLNVIKYETEESGKDEKNEPFNLVQYLQEITYQSTEKILHYCNKLRLDRTMKPPEATLNLVVSKLLGPSPIVVIDSESSSDADNSISIIENNSGMTEEKMLEHVEETINACAKNIIHEPVDLCDPQPSCSSTDQKTIQSNENSMMIQNLKGMFPDACPNYIEHICLGKSWHDLDDVLNLVLSENGNYPKRPERPKSPEIEIDPEEQMLFLKELLPDADPTYLQMLYEKHAQQPELLREAINDAIERRNYPTMKEYLRKQQISAQQKQYTSEFKVENFVQIFPDPQVTFSDSKRNIKMDAESTNYLQMFLYNKYNKLPVQKIRNIVRQSTNVAICIKSLDLLVSSGHIMKSRRKIVQLPNNVQNIPLLQELAYYEHLDDINNYLEEQKMSKEAERAEAKANGLTETCMCCYDEEVMPSDLFTCTNGCKFCRDCIQKSTEVAMGEGKMDFPCLSDCNAEFTLQTLQCVLPPKMFSKLAQKKALVEVKAAGIEDLEMCPFCDFASIPHKNDKIFRCFNPDCMKESCRLCKEPSHIPLKCDEVEKDESVKARTYVENKMTEALLRTCWKCNAKFFKEEGCNKMTCYCGAQMCYICKKPVTDYNHFNGMGGDKFHLCPLYSDTATVNKEDVKKGAAEAKAEVDTSKLKIDPSADIDNHYKKAKRDPYVNHMAVPPFPLQQYIHGPAFQGIIHAQIRAAQGLHRNRHRRHRHGHPPFNPGNDNIYPH